ncbi:MAG: CRISPR-associated protein Cas4 [Hyphomicrobiaceae bacterium]
MSSVAVPAAPDREPVPPVPDAVTAFHAVVERANLHALPFQHLALCGRRAWFHLKRIDYAHLDGRMQRGLVIHETVRPRDSSVEGLMGLAPDRIDWDKRVVYESKGGAGAKDAVSRQTAFYALMLWRATGHPWRAVTHIVAAKRSRDVPMTDTLICEMLEDARRLADLAQRETPPPADEKPICAACSYRFLCGYA